MTTSTASRLPTMLSIRQVAEHYGVCSKTVSRWIKQHGLRVHRVGRTIRVSDEDAIHFMAARRG
jgi:excisionase family DNA binding protein